MPGPIPDIGAFAGPRAPLGHLSRLGFVLVGAASVDEVARGLLADLLALPGVHRVGLALSEGGGRRLRFTASDRVDTGAVDWCHIDAYDDVPLTRVVRTGSAVMGPLDLFRSSFGDFVARQPDSVLALAALPLPGVGSPIGGLLVFFDQPREFTAAERRLLEATARRTAEAVRRVRSRSAAVATHPAAQEADPSVRTGRIALEDDPRSAGVARRFLRQLLAAHVPDDVLETAQLCLSELVTNAVVHASTTSELVVTLDERLFVAVRDHGGGQSTQPSVDHGDPLRVHGRGLQLVEAMADRWGSESDADGTTVWFELTVDGHRRQASDTG